MGDWWRDVEVKEFEQRVKSMVDSDLIELGREVRAAATRISLDLQNHGPDQAWLIRARSALRHTVERKRIVAYELEQRSVQGKGQKYVRVKTLVTECREKLDGGDTEGALRLVLDWMDPDLRKERDR